METLFQDVRFALRGLLRNPGFTLVALASLALGIGVNSAMFSSVYQVLMRPLPFEQADRLVEVRLDPDARASRATLGRLWGHLERLDDVAGWSAWTFTLTGHDQPERIAGARVSSNLFALLGVEAEQGRALMFEDGGAGSEPVAVISHGLWSRLYGGDGEVVGRAIVLDGTSRTVVGVMPRSFAFPSTEAAVWVPDPLDPSDQEDFQAENLRLVARLAPGATLDQAIVELKRASVELRTVFDDYSPTFGNRASARPVRDALVGETKSALLVLFGAVGFVLLIVCANVASLLLGRAATRRKEIAVRAALGAPRGRVVRQLLTESVCLASLGGGLGLLLAFWSTDLLGSALPAMVPGVGEVGVGREVLVFTLLVSLMAGIVFGLAPAIQSSGTVVRETLRDKGRHGTDAGGVRGMLSVIMVAEVALALVLVTGAGLMIQNFWRLSRVHPGFEANGVLTLRLSPARAEYDAAERREYWARILRDVGLEPGIEAVAAIDVLPFEQVPGTPSDLEVEQGAVLPAERAPAVEWRVVTAGYFNVLDIPVHTGRVFSDRDRSGTERVAVVSRSLARRLFLDQDPLGRHIRSTADRPGVWTTIVGVVDDTRDQANGDIVQGRIYRPFAQHPAWSMALVVRTLDEPARHVPELGDVIRAVDPEVPISSVRPLADLVSQSLAPARLLAQLLALFGALAVLLGAVGIYGVTSFAVSHRRTEIGVRLAFGAEAGAVLWQVMRQSLELVGVGLVLGLVGALVLTRILQSRVYQLDPTGPLGLAVITLVLCAVGVAASYLPSRRASRAAPSDALRPD